MYIYIYIYSVFSPGYHFSSLYYSPSFLLLFPPLFFLLYKDSATQPRLGWNCCLSLVGLQTCTIKISSLLVNSCLPLKVLDLLKLLHIISPALRCHTVYRSASMFHCKWTHLLVGLLSFLRKDPSGRKALDLIRICLGFFGTKDSVHISIS